jgi:hypothetical protein
MKPNHHKRPNVSAPERVRIRRVALALAVAVAAVGFAGAAASFMLGIDPTACGATAAAGLGVSAFA